MSTSPQSKSVAASVLAALPAKPDSKGQSVARHVLTGLAGALILKGKLSPTDAVTYVGLLVWLLPVAQSWLSKTRIGLWLHTAIMLPPDSSRAALTEAVKVALNQGLVTDPPPPAPPLRVNQ